MDVDTVLLSVQERDKWRHRLSLLQTSLTDTRDRRLHLQDRLKRIRAELRRLGDFSEALLDQARGRAGTVHGSANTRLPAR
jgi:hypothetical protein